MTCMHRHRPANAGRRGFITGAGALLLSPALGSAQSIGALSGEVRVKGRRATPATAIRAGDTVITGSGASIAFALGQDAFLLRADSVLKVERSGELDTLAAGLRMLTGALVAVFGKSPRPRSIQTTTATAGIRGTGVYIEASAEQTYFCTCYGEVELLDNRTQTRHLVVSANHSPVLIYARATAGAMMEQAMFKNHSNAELQMIEAMVGRRSPLGG